ncbi:MAG: TRAP transporter substrate-binding protein [Deltaproteobacteria bacterium]|nr:TRAP transporter substrate-binding protein [Deltaproteobacteria bacterium]
MIGNRFLVTIVSLAMVLVFAGSGGAAQQYTLKISHIEATGGAADTTYLYLKKILEEKSGGRIKVILYTGKSMAQSDTEQGEIVRQNVVQLVPLPTHTLSSMANIPQFSVFEFPYVFEDLQEIYKLLDSDLAKSWTKILEDEVGVVVYEGFVRGWLSLGTKKAINTPSDLKGLKIRTMATDMQMALISALGASPTIIAYGELYTAQQQGTVDGILTVTQLYDTDRFAEVIDNLSVIRATAHFLLPTVNKKWLDSLPEDLRAIFDECMKEYIAYGRDYEAKLDKKVLEEMPAKYNVKVRQYTDEELAPFKAAVKKVWDDNYDRPGKGVMDEVLKFLGKDREELFK